MCTLKGSEYQSWQTRRYETGGLGSIRNQINLSHPELEAVYDSYYKGDISEGKLLDEMISAAEAAGVRGSAAFDTPE